MGKKSSNETTGKTMPGNDSGMAAGSLLSFWKYGIPSEPIFVKGDVELGVLPVKAGSAPEGDAIHDLQGRRLSGIPQKGIYIRNGRKYVR